MAPALSSNLYAGLADALADPASVPVWLAMPGYRWPLYRSARLLAEKYVSPGMVAAVENLDNLQESSLHFRLSAWKKLLSVNGERPLVVYESIYRHGRLLGPVMFDIKAEYQRAGLAIEGPELPDHIAVELEFLSFLAEKEALGGEAAQRWRQVRRNFINKHANDWMPAVGQELAASGDPAWEVIGQLLVEVFNLSVAAKSLRAGAGLPHLHQVGLCSLCGFCAQVCPEKALRISEDDLSTRLQLFPDRCIRCGKCERACEQKALTLKGEEHSEALLVLRQSPRARCPGCGQATISMAELTAVESRLGSHPHWLDYCLTCRGLSLYQNGSRAC